MESSKGESEQQADIAPAPKPYERPAITDLGTLAELTHSNPQPVLEIDGGSEQ